MNEKKLLPRFETEAEEARWYAEHRDDLHEYFDVAEEGDPELEALLAKSPRRPGRPPSLDPARQVQFRIPEGVIDRVKNLAERKGMRYQTLIKSWIFKALADEEKKAL
ncbi:MAG: BrnA antitoxin family protein [Cyanobacteria bacterium REEB65]|nr:BrnA antitoxin family protein [Cyanobacteria bacterium REEB65]